MKKTLSVLLVCALILGMLMITACSSSEKKGDKAAVDETNLSFSTVADVKGSGTAYEFAENRGVEDDMIVCTIKKDASGELTIPAKYDDKTVIALISEDKTNEGVTSLTVEDGVSYIDSCFAESSKALAALSLPESLTGIYQSFNKCEALNALSTPSGLKDLSNSFCDCANLAKIETTSYLHDLTGSFNNTPKLADVTIGGSIQKLESSFNKCGLTALSFTENVHGISDSFNDCPALASITLDQIAGSVSKAFVKCPKLTTLTYKQGGERIGYSFNDNALLEKVDFGGGVGNIFNSFQNCPKYKLPETPAE